MRTNNWDDLPQASHPPSSSTLGSSSLETPEFPFKKISSFPKLSYALENLIISFVTLFAAFIDCTLTLYVWLPVGLARSFWENVVNISFFTRLYSRRRMRRSPNGTQDKTQVIVISGASSGIGASLVKKYANPNNVLILLARNPTRLNQIAKIARILGCKSVETHSIDYSHETAQNSIRDLIQSSHQKYGSIDIVFSNAGTSTFTDDDPHGPQAWGEKTVQRLNKINVLSTYTFIMTAWEIMKKQRSGNICIISSILAFQGPPEFAGYSGTKANLLTFSQSLRSLSTPYGIQVNCICPGFVKTGMSMDLLAAGSTVPQLLMGDSNDCAKRIKAAVDENHSAVIWPISHALPGILGSRFNWLNSDLFRWAFSKAGLNGQVVT